VKDTDEGSQLMLRFQQGDRAAFDVLFRRFSRPVLGFLTRMVRDRGRAEELAQETFVRVYQARDRYQPRAKFTTFLFAIAHNLALNELARARHALETSLEPAQRAVLVDPGPGADQLLEASRAQARLERALGDLPERQRAALLLRSTENLGYDEIAAALEVSVSSVKSLLHRARERLLAELGEEDLK
jgi:RNA polymerase sigma-70 factor (ECF subfamily)